MREIFEKLKVYYKLSFVVAVTIYFAIKVIISHFFFRDKNRYRKNATKWATLVNRIFNITIDVQGLENLNKKDTYIFASNHQSLLDIPILFQSLKDFNYVIIYKKELEKLPVFGYNLKISPFISIDRADPRNAMASIETTLNQMNDNDAPIIFPEGTRSFDGKLGEFKRGAFLIASRSKKPIVPITVIGSAQVLPKHTLKIKTKSTVKVIINFPISNSNIMDRNDERALMNKVYSIIKLSFEENFQN